MALRTIRIQGDPVLTKKCREITEMTPKLMTLIEDMLDTMYEANGVGLAAPQVTYLMHELKEKGLNVNTEATTVAEARESLLEVLLGREPNHRGSNLEEENLC